MRRCALILFSLSSLVVTQNSAAATAPVRLRSLVAGQQLLVRTKQRVYQIELVNAGTGEARVAASNDGVHYGPEQRMFILGSTPEHQSGDGGFAVVQMGELQEGQRIEWARDASAATDRGITSPIKSIEMMPADH